MVLRGIGGGKCWGRAGRRPRVFGQIEHGSALYSNFMTNIIIDSLPVPRIKFRYLREDQTRRVKSTCNVTETNRQCRRSLRFVCRHLLVSDSIGGSAAAQMR